LLNVKMENILQQNPNIKEDLKIIIFTEKEHKNLNNNLIMYSMEYIKMVLKNQVLWNGHKIINNIFIKDNSMKKDNLLKKLNLRIQTVFMKEHS
jgi:hypothetical protein